MDWLVIADDLTGACDTGGAFTGSSQSVKVALDLSQGLPAADVLVVSTESRSLGPDAAAAAVSLLFKSVSLVPGSRFYKKIDSTLRGQPWIELAEVMKHVNCKKALVAPAFPEQGRTVQQGTLLVNGTPLEQTVFAAPGASSLLDGLAESGLQPSMLAIEDVRKGESWVEHQLQTALPGVVVADAETTADLRILARAFLESGLRLACGSAGLARALAAESGQREKDGALIPEGGAVLVIAGSRHPATEKQVAYAEVAGVQVIEVEFADLRVANWRKKLLKRISRAFMMQKTVMLSASALPYRAGQEQRIATDLARVVVDVMNSIPVNGLVLTGGETASAVCREVHSQAIDLVAEILPGMVWGVLEGGSAQGVGVVTKAGGFGEEDALLIALDFLARSP